MERGRREDLPLSSLLFLHPSASLTRYIFFFLANHRIPMKPGPGEIHACHAVQIQREESPRTPLGLQEKNNI